MYGAQNLMVLKSLNPLLPVINVLEFRSKCSLVCEGLSSLVDHLHK